ncbi:MAG: glycosyltransferase 87 family protein [Streptosporangiaceae bacterium]
MGVRAGVTWATGAVYLASAGACCALAARSSAHFADTEVYRMGGAAVLHGESLYRLRAGTLPFTYPPFAAIVLTVLAVIPPDAAVALLTAASTAALPVMLYLALRLPGPGGPAGAAARREASTVALAVAAAAIWLDPARAALGYGQVDIVLAAAVLYDLALPATSRWKGAATGLAAGIKLTPAIFAVYLLLTRRYRAAATAAAVFAGTVAAGFAVLPASSAWFWAGEFASPGRVSPVQDPENQSLLGVLSRTLHTASVLPLWLALAAAVAVTGLALAAAAGRRGDEAAGFSLCAVTGLLISPISWTHHWVIAIPALLVAGRAVSAARRAGRTAAARLGAAGIAAVAVIGWTRLAQATPASGWLAMPAPALACSAAYVLIGLFTLALAAWNRLRGTPGTLRPPPADDL